MCGGKGHSQQKLARQLNIPKTNVDWWLHLEGGLNPHYSSLKPSLMEQNKYSQLLYALEMVNPNDTTKFRDMYDCIYVDEKWFYLMHDRQ